MTERQKYENAIIRTQQAYRRVPMRTRTERHNDRKIKMQIGNIWDSEFRCIPINKDKLLQINQDRKTKRQR